MLDAVYRIEIETAAARALLASITHVIGDDEEAAGDAVEGETSLHEAIDAGLKRMADLRAMSIGLEAHIQAMKARLDRVEKADDKIRHALFGALKASRQKKIERPLATISLRVGAQSVEVSNIDILPVWLKRWKGWEADKVAIKAAIKSGAVVVGAQLVDAGETLSVKGL